MKFHRTRQAIAVEVSTLLVPEPSGVGIFGRSLIEALSEHLGSAAIHLVFRISRFRSAWKSGSIRLPLKPYIRGNLLHWRYPLLHCLDTRVPSRYHGRMIATVFDVISLLPATRQLRLSSKKFQARKLLQYSQIANRADAIVFISEDTRNRFLEAFQFRGAARVVYPGVDRRFCPEASREESLRRLGLQRGRYLLCVGELCTRKNLEAALGAFRRARETCRDLELAIAGKVSFGWNGSAAQKSILSDPEGIHVLGYLPARDLAAAYAGARALLYLSHHEGFGLPVLEAMASGVPVIAARRGGIPEAAGEAGLLVDPDRPEEVDRALEAVLGSQREWEERSQAGLAHAASFSWDRCAAKIAEVYRSVLDG